MPRFLLAAVLAVALGATAASAAPTPSPPPGVGECSPGLGIGLLEVPRATLKDPRARNYVVDSVKPGTTFTRRLKVCNGTNNPLKVLLYPDSATISKGSFLLAPGRGANDLTSWMSLTPDSLTVPPGKAIVATAKFAVPSDAGGGERYGGIVADSPAIGSSGGVALGGRVAIRVYLSVSAGSTPKSDFTVDSLQAVRAKNGTPAVLAQVHNTGARALDMRGSLRLDDGPGGLSAGPFDAKLGTTLAPGDTAAVVVPLSSAIRGGPWHAVISMKSGLLERRAEGSVTFPEAAGDTSPAVPAKALPIYQDKGVVVPVAIVLIGIVWFCLLLLLLLRRRKRRRDEKVESVP